MLKFLLLIALCITAFTPTERGCLRQITIVHTGMEDKPIGTLILSTKILRRVYADDEFPTKVVLTEEEFTRVVQLIKTFDSATHRQLPKGNLEDYGTFNMTVFDACKQLSDNSYQRGRSKDLFRFLLKHIKSFEPNNRKKVELKLNAYLMM